MGHNIFVSYKYKDTDVRLLPDVSPYIHGEEIMWMHWRRNCHQLVILIMEKKEMMTYQIKLKSTSIII